MGLNQEYDWNWDKKVDIKISDTSPTITLERDLLDRSKYARFLTNTLNSYEESSAVLNLNAEWGAGKTWFIRRWYSTIKNIHPSVYIDAWKSDYSEDPLLAVISGIKDSLSKYDNSRSEAEKQNFFKHGGRFLKQVTPSLFSALLKTYTGFDSDNFELEDLSGFSEKALEVCLKNHNETGKDLELFKRSIEDLLNDSIDSYGNGFPRKPMYIFIDELDRCRPTYAVEFLEIVKHLFDVPGIVFVIATNTNQLQHSIRSIYGSGFDANRYLYRFFNNTYSLANPPIGDFISSQECFYMENGLANGLMNVFDDSLSVTCKDDISNNLAAIASFFDFDLRTIQQWISQLHATLILNEYKDSYFWVTFAFLSAFKIYNPDFFSRVYDRKLSPEFSRISGIDDIKDALAHLSSRSSEKLKFSFRPTYVPRIELEHGGWVSVDDWIVVEISPHRLVDSIYDPFFKNSSDGQYVRELIDNISHQRGRRAQMMSAKVYSLIQYSYNFKFNSELKNYVELVQLSTDFK